jgi:hypothetical protein
MSRLMLFISAVALAVAVVGVAPAVGAVTKVECSGTAAFTGITNVQSHTVGTETFVSFDYSGVHDWCLADGSVVLTTIVGHIDERLGPDGGLTLQNRDEFVTYNGSTQEFAGDLAFDGSKLESRIHTVGRGSGIFAGMNSEGTFAPTATPGVFTFRQTVLYTS